MIETFPNISNDIENALIYYATDEEFGNDLLVLTVGHESCTKNKRIIGPLQHGYYILHYVHAGKGHLSLYTKDEGKKDFTIRAGELFLLRPNDNVLYRPDEDDPWEYSWVCFCGSFAFSYARRLSDRKTPLICPNRTEKIEELFKQFRNLKDYPKSKDIRVLALTLQIFSTITENTDTERPNFYKNYVRECLLYVQKNYSDPELSIKQISDYLNLNEKYLSRLFTAANQMPLSKYITLLRLQKACSLLNNSDMPVQQIAAHVGYNDALYFSRIFVKNLGTSPTKWRKQNHTGPES